MKFGYLLILSLLVAGCLATQFLTNRDKAEYLKTIDDRIDEDRDTIQQVLERCTCPELSSATLKQDFIYALVTNPNTTLPTPTLNWAKRVILQGYIFDAETERLIAEDTTYGDEYFVSAITMMAQRLDTLTDPTEKWIACYLATYGEDLSDYRLNHYWSLVHLIHISEKNRFFTHMESFEPKSGATEEQVKQALKKHYYSFHHNKRLDEVGKKITLVAERNARYEAYGIPATVQSFRDRDGLKLKEFIPAFAQRATVKTAKELLNYIKYLGKDAEYNGLENNCIIGSKFIIDFIAPESEASEEIQATIDVVLEIRRLVHAYLKFCDREDQPSNMLITVDNLLIITLAIGAHYALAGLGVLSTLILEEETEISKLNNDLDSLISE